MNNATLHRALCLTAWIAGLFCLLLCAVMLYEHFAAATNDPWKSPQLLALKDKLAADPKDQALQSDIRLMDQKFRQRFRVRIELDRSGGWLLLGGMLVLALSAGKAAALSQTLPSPQPKTGDAESSLKLAARARLTLVVVALVVAGSLVIIRVANTSSLPADTAVGQKLPGKTGAPETALEPPLALAEFQANWPRFRGWDGSGVTAQTNFVTNLAWRTAILAPGHCSPVVWGDRVFISGGTQQKREVFCYNVSNGALLWRRAVENVPGSPAKVPEVPSDTTYAASTVAADGRRVYAMFANGDLGAINFDGSVAWTKYLGPLKNSFGYAASLAIWGNSLIVQLDQGGGGSEEEERPATNPAQPGTEREAPRELASAGGKSRLISLQCATGRILWQRSRPVPSTWSTPIVVEAAGKTQIIALGKPWVIGYEQTNGNELWRAELLKNSTELVPSPVFAGGLVVMLDPGSTLFALHPDGAGNVTQTRVAWTNEGNFPDIPSPVSAGDLVFTVTSAGMVKCLQTADGKQIWETNLDTTVQSSPVIAGDRLFVLTKDGALVMLRAARDLQEFGRTQLPDDFLASPAFAGGRIFLRGASNLFCLGPDAGKLAKQP
jgi:outer membrane protein assembly factor BamB